MSWFSFTDIAKNALSEAQKKIDKALDIQARAGVEDHGVKQNETPTPVAETDSKYSESGPTQPKKGGFKTNKKPTRTSKPGGSLLRAKRITADISEDFFSVLDNESSSLNAHLSQNFAHPTSFSREEKFVESGKTLSKESESKLQSDVESIPEGDSNASLASDSNFTEVSLVVADEVEENSNKNSDTTEEILNGSHSSVSLEVVSDTKKHTAISPTRDSSLSPGESIVGGNLGKIVDFYEKESTNKPAASEDKTFSMSQESSTQRPISPVSTAASSEIDILDHESTLSEVSSRCNEGQIFIQSPLHLQNIDAADSDASQALSPVLDEMKYTKKSLSPPSDDEPTKQLNESPPAHSFKPLEHVNSLTPEPQPTTEVQAMTPTSELHIEEPPTAVEVVETTPQMNDEKKRVELSEKMEVYEHQLMTLSQKNAQLNEENDNLRSEVVRMKEEYENEVSSEVEKVANSYKSLESNNNVLKEEKANLLKQITVLKSQLASRMTNEQVQNAIAEKEESIKGLMEEGEALAKKHLQQNNLIKKLKSQSQEKDAELKSLREKVTKYETENSKMKEELRVAHGQGQEERETSLRITDAYEQRERETQILQEKLSQSDEKQRTLQVNLDAAYKEIGDLHKQIAEQESRTLIEWKAKEDEILRENDLNKKKILSEQEHQRQLLMLQIMESNNSVSRTEAAAARKDDDHRREIRELQQRLQESEGRNQDLSNNVSSATRPLLRQIENLQATHSSQHRTWNALEKTLNSRLGEAQAELLVARESERIAQSSAIEAKSKAAAFEKHIESVKKTISLQESEVESLGKQIEEYKVQAKSLTEELEELKITHKESVHKSRKERLFLENQLQMEKVRLEAERKRHAAQQEVFQKEKDRLMWSRSEMTSVSSNQIVETESVGSSNDAFHATDGMEKQHSSASLPGLVSQLSFDGGRTMSMSNILENLQTQLKLRDGEIAQLRGDVNMLERTRSSMAEEIVRLTNLNEDLEGVSKELQSMREKLAEVESRYTAILTMYGEKEEENEELKMDLADVKAMYRQQINDLLTADTTS